MHTHIGILVYVHGNMYGCNMCVPSWTKTHQNSVLAHPNSVWIFFGTGLNDMSVREDRPPAELVDCGGAWAPIKIVHLLLCVRCIRTLHFLTWLSSCPESVTVPTGMDWGPQSRDVRTLVRILLLNSTIFLGNPFTCGPPLSLHRSFTFVAGGHFAL